MIRKANISDPPAIMKIVNRFAARELMLPRPLNEVYENLRDFFLYEQEGRILGCAALHVTWVGLGEIRSLAVDEESQGQGIGTRLVQECLQEARQLGMKRVFVLTYMPPFFHNLGFRDYSKDELPHKIWTDCLRCPKFPNCEEEALVIDLEDDGEA